MLASPVAALAAAALTIFFLSASPAVAAEKWITNAESAPEMVPPFQRTLYAGEVIRMRVLRNSALRVSFGEGTKGGFAVVAPVKDFEQTEDKRFIQDYPVVLTYSHEEVDYAVLKVVIGMVAVVADLSPMREEYVEEGQEVSFRVEPYMEVRGRFVNLSDFRSIVSYEFRRNGEDVSRSGERDRTIVLNFRNSASEKLWCGTADELIVKVTRGRVLVKAGQPFDVILDETW